MLRMLAVLARFGYTQTLSSVSEHTPHTAMKSAMLLLLALIVAPEVAMATNAAGLAFLAENKGKDGVVELPCVRIESLRPC
jgi:hypothetical protein